MIARVPELTDIHHIHVWLLTTERPLMTMHATIAEGADPGPVLLQIKNELHENFGISHSTVQIEGGACADDHIP